MDDPAVVGIDIDAIADAIRALSDEQIDVEAVERIDRSGDDGRVRWTMTCEADTRTADLGDFTDG
jgi:hypothetical protein